MDKLTELSAQTVSAETVGETLRSAFALALTLLAAAVVLASPAAIAWRLCVGGAL